MSRAELFEEVDERVGARRVSPDLLRSALREFAGTGRLPRDPAKTGDAIEQARALVAVRDAVLDVETAAHLAAGGDPSGKWLVLVAACRDGGSPAADSALAAARGSGTLPSLAGGATP